MWWLSLNLYFLNALDLIWKDLSWPDLTWLDLPWPKKQVTYVQSKMNGKHCNLSIKLWLRGHLSQHLSSSRMTHVTKTDTGHVQTTSLDAHLGHVLPDRLTARTHTNFRQTTKVTMATMVTKVTNVKMTCLFTCTYVDACIHLHWMCICISVYLCMYYEYAETCHKHCIEVKGAEVKGSWGQRCQGQRVLRSKSPEVKKVPKLRHNDKDRGKVVILVYMFLQKSLRSTILTGKDLSAEVHTQSQLFNESHLVQ